MCFNILMTDKVLMTDLFYGWHFAGTFDCQSRTEGPIGTMRFDAEPTVPPREGRLPDATKGFDHLSDVFAKQMGLSDKDIVVLSGAHISISPFQS
ncbi:hypothetical protein ARALYDRAFT_901815 [Arabidopsis lyrata subsp. lyrata]|uniref:Plant heme peroxidase family profile domain-containing protein n=1 Tax=Arabidopsis lyrata subsp. lyrata TaxID=81972 RepID=D7LJN2_ARALL|nr:hypothetical protein ARALYDRAFT_901815 [Arabidopsis lyrata subsp. lyrata]